MVWTRDNIPEECWPLYWGLGNELTGIIPPSVYAADIARLQQTVQKVFGKTHSQVRTYAPCGCESPAANVELLAHLKSNGTLLDAWSWHTYGHPQINSSSAAALLTGSVEPINASFRVFSAVNQAVPPSTRPLGTDGQPAASWITETAFTANPPCRNMTTCNGGTAPVSSMLRAIDMSWYIDALGSAARAGASVFCKETLVGDWLETIGSWQQGAGLPQYTPHPDFWVAALWSQLMGTGVLDVSLSVPNVPPPPSPPSPFIPWVEARGFTAVAGEGSGYPDLLLGVNITSEEKCRALCESHENCTIYTGAETGVPCTMRPSWCFLCIGRTDRVFDLHPVNGVVSARRVEVGPSPQPRLPAQHALRAYAHVSQGPTTRTITYAFASLWLNRSMEVALANAGESATAFILSSAHPGDDIAQLNGMPLLIGLDDTMPALVGVPVLGGRVTLPPRSVGFVTTTTRVMAPFRTLLIVSGSSAVDRTAAIIANTVRSKSGCTVTIRPANSAPKGKIHRVDPKFAS